MPAGWQGYRTVDVLSSFVAKHMVPEVTDLGSVEELEEMVEEEGVVVLGLFHNATDKYTQTFGEVAKKWRRYVRFVRVSDTAAATSFAEAYEVDEVPAVLIVKRRDVVLQFDGALTKRADIEDFVNMYAFPLVGKWGVLTYYRYKVLSSANLHVTPSPPLPQHPSACTLSCALPLPMQAPASPSCPLRCRTVPRRAYTSSTPPTRRRSSRLLLTPWRRWPQTTMRCEGQPHPQPPQCSLLHTDLRI